MLVPAVVFGDPLRQGNVPVPSYLARKSVQRWCAAARAHVLTCTDLLVVS